MSDAEWVSAERLVEIFESVKSWGRWGADDEAGALNLLTDERRRAAAAEVQAGEVVSLARELPVEPSVENLQPALHMMMRGGDDCVLPGVGLEMSADLVGVAFHGMATSHIDALCHVFVDGRMFNGFPASDVKSTGATRLEHTQLQGGAAREQLTTTRRVGAFDELESALYVALERYSNVHRGTGHN